MDIVVKGNGLFRYENPTYDISSSVSGKISEVNVEEGAYVECGDHLITLDSTSLKEKLKVIQSNLNDVKDRLSILEAYEKYLDGKKGTRFISNKSVLFGVFK